MYASKSAADAWKAYHLRLRWRIAGSSTRLPARRWFGFYAVFGFVACVVLVLVAKYILRPLVMRKENYYDD